MTIKTGVFGASGYTGQELIHLLDGHAAMQVVFAVSDTYAGQAVNGDGLVYQATNQTDMGQADVIFLCTPHGASAPLAARALDAGAKVVDLSADFRLKRAATYAQWYGQPHALPALLPIPYGLPELNRTHLPNHNLIANPGCYPTATLLGLAPLARQGALQPGAPLAVDAKSGVSGAGHKPRPGTHFVEVYGDLKPYSIGRTHRHVGEIEQELHDLDANAGPIIFTPHLLPVDRGILATIYAPLAEEHTPEDLHALYAAQYGAEPLVDVLPLGATARLRDAVRTNKAVISVHGPTPHLALIVVAIDNLRKGAASQAIQNANILFDLDETTGLLE